jgi:uncharacterized membrane protein YfhO
MLAGGEADGSEVAYVQGDIPEVSPPPDSASPDVSVSRWSPDSLTIDVSHSGEGLLVVSQVHSENWKATVDGEEVVVLQTDHALLGIPVSPGEHEIVVRYDPDSLRLGLWISGLTSIGAIGAIGYAGWTITSQRREPDTSPV